VRKHGHEEIQSHIRRDWKGGSGEDEITEDEIWLKKALGALKNERDHVGNRARSRTKSLRKVKKSQRKKNEEHLRRLLRGNTDNGLVSTQMSRGKSDKNL